MMRGESGQGAARALVGTWRLVSYEIAGADGRVRRPYGDAPVGLLLYGADGCMAVAFGSAGRAGFASGDALRGTTAEWAVIARSFTSYAGRYEIEGDRVLHHVEVSLYPDWVGTIQERFLALDEPHLTLRMPPYTHRGVTMTGRLVWERVGRRIDQAGTPGS